MANSPLGLIESREILSSTKGKTIPLGWLHHSQTFPIIWYNPKSFGSNEYTGAVPTNPSINPTTFITFILVELDSAATVAKDFKYKLVIVDDNTILDEEDNMNYRCLADLYKVDNKK